MIRAPACGRGGGMKGECKVVWHVTYIVVSLEMRPPPWIVRIVPPANEPFLGSIEEMNP
jgi:hypothetical protein